MLHLVLNSTLATASVANKSNLVLAQSVRSNPDCLQTVLPVFSLGTNLFILRSIELLNNITVQSWPSIGNCTQVSFFDLVFNLVVLWRAVGASSFNLKTR